MNFLNKLKPRYIIENILKHLLKKERIIFNDIYSNIDESVPRYDDIESINFINILDKAAKKAEEEAAAAAKKAEEAAAAAKKAEEEAAAAAKKAEEEPEKKNDDATFYHKQFETELKRLDLDLLYLDELHNLERDFNHINYYRIVVDNQPIDNQPIDNQPKYLSKINVVSDITNKIEDGIESMKDGIKSITGYEHITIPTFSNIMKPDKDAPFLNIVKTEYNNFDNVTDTKILDKGKDIQDKK